MGKFIWWLQRITVVVMTGCISVGLAILSSSEKIGGYEKITELFDSSLFAVLFVLYVISVGLHAVVGLWSVGEDYLNERALGQRSNWAFPLWKYGVATIAISYTIWAFVLSFG